MRRDLPYAIIVPPVMVGFAVVLMIWAISGSSGGRMASQAPAMTTTGAALPRLNASTVRLPVAASNDTAAAANKGR
jgi:hypothetical protein